MSNAPSLHGEKSVPLVVKEIVFDEQTIARRVEELSLEITRDYRHKDFMVVGILKGAFLFACDLIRRIPLDLALDFIAISRYSQQPQGGEVRIIKDLQEDISRKHILLIEDIVDTGLTLNYLVRILLSRDPASLAICTLLDRPELRLVDIPIKYVGFNVSHEFLIGYGLDYRDRYRNLPFIATMNLPTPLSADN